jgi:HrpA-like RNA helicase
MHRNFGSKSYDKSPIGGYKNKLPHYSSERGVRPLPEIPTDITNRRQRRLAARSITKEVIYPEAHEPYGDPNLPIAEKLNDITDSILNNPITVVKGETGSGKSTQTPLGLLNADKGSIMMQPRRLAAEMVADRIDYHVKEKRPYDSYGFVGVLTAEKNTLTPDTRVSVVTDGVLIRQLPEMLRRNDQRAIILDEIHEWKRETEIAMALIKHELLTNPDSGIRVVLMSATHDMEVINDFFKDVTPGHLPVFEIPGIIHEIEDREEPESTIAEQAFIEGSQEKSVLVFVQGKQEIKDTIDEITRKFREAGGTTPAILPLHAKLSKAARDAALADYPNGKIIVSTDVAQTSITIDVDTVIDSGQKREPHIDEEYSQSLDGVLASRSDMRQRRGRSGRIKPGTYIVTRATEDDEFIAIDNPTRPEYSVPEIQRTEADRTVLYVASLGYDAEVISFPHPIDLSVIRHAKESLMKLGALDENGLITPLGRKMESLPMSPTLARMVVEAEQYSVKTRAQVMAITTSAEVGGLQYFAQGVGKKWKELVNQNDSDMLAQLEIFMAAQSMSKREQAQYNLDPQNIENAQRLFRKVMKRSGIDHDELESPTNIEVDNIKRCIYSGMIDYVYQYSGDGEYTRVGGEYPTPRSISNRSVVDHTPPMIVGHPYRYSYENKGEEVTKHIVEKVTKVTTPAVLGEIASRLCVWKPQSHSMRGGRLVVQEGQFYDTMELGVIREVEAKVDDSSVKYLVGHIMENPGSALKELRGIESTIKTLRKLSPHAPDSIHDEIERMVTEAVVESGLNESYADQILRNKIYEGGISLQSFISDGNLAKIYENSPSAIEQEGRQLALTYEQGVPLVKRFDLDEAALFEDEVVLPDGRLVKFVGERGKRFTVADLKNLQGKDI